MYMLYHYDLTSAAADGLPRKFLSSSLDEQKREEKKRKRWKIQEIDRKSVV